MDILKQKIKILVADDHHLLREGLISLLNTESTFEVVGQAENGKEVLSFLENFKTDIVLLDDRMPVMSGREALSIIARKYPKIKVIMLTMNFGMAYEFEYKALGAHSFLTKETDSEELFEAIIEVHNGKYFYTGKPRNIHIAAIFGRHNQLSLNEIQLSILKYVCDNKTNSFISKRLEINEHTVRYHRKAIYAKTKTSSITDLVKYAIKNRLISLD